jgi:hypothetical protein
MRGGRRYLAPIDRGKFTIGTANENQATAANAGVISIDDPQRKRGRHGRIHRIAATAKHVSRGIRGNWMPRRHHPPLTRCRIGNGNITTKAQCATDNEKPYQDNPTAF